MSKRETRQIELDATAADVLEARAAERGVSISQLIAELLNDSNWPGDLEAMSGEGAGPWSVEGLAEDQSRQDEFERTQEGVPWEEIRSWLQTWGKPGELPPPKPRKL